MGKNRKTEDMVDNTDKYGRERQMLVEHKGVNRATRRAMKRGKRSYVPRATNAPFVKEA